MPKDKVFAWPKPPSFEMFLNRLAGKRKSRESLRARKLGKVPLPKRGDRGYANKMQAERVFHVWFQDA